jgi:hypothetical protein
MGKQLGKYWGNNCLSNPFQTILNHFAHLQEFRQITFIYQHRRHFTAVHESFLSDSVGIRNNLRKYVCLLVFSSFASFVWGNI